MGGILKEGRFLGFGQAINVVFPKGVVAVHMPNHHPHHFFETAKILAVAHGFQFCAPRDDAQLGESGFERAQVGVLLTEKSHQVETLERKNGFMHVEDKSSFLTFAFVTPITLISDFGADNMYVGLLKGSILKRMPEAQIVDLTHSIRKFDPVHAAFVLRAAMDVFPKGTVHVIGINAVETPDHPHRIVMLNGQYFIGADTGIFQLMGAKQPDAVFDMSGVQTDEDLPDVSRTFPLRAGSHPPRERWHSGNARAPCVAGDTGGKRAACRRRQCACRPRAACRWPWKLHHGHRPKLVQRSGPRQAVLHRHAPRPK